MMLMRFGFSSCHDAYYSFAGCFSSNFSPVKVGISDWASLWYMKRKSIAAIKSLVTV